MRLHGGIVVPVVANDVLVGVVQLVVVALDVLAPIAELNVRDVGQAAVGVARVGLLNVLGRHGVPGVHEHGPARRDGGDRRRVPVIAHRVVGVVLNLRHAVGYNDVRGFVPAHVLHGDLVFDYIANGVVGLYGRGFLPGIERIVTRDGQGPVDLLNRVVVRHVAIGVGDLRGGNLRDCLIHADQRLRALAVIQHVCVQGIARQQTSVAVRRLNGVARHVVCRMRHGVLVVVGILQPFSSDLHRALVDDQLAVVHNELDVREVVADVLEVAFLQTHLVLVRVGARRLGGASKLEVVYRVQSAVFAIDLDAVDLVAINAVFVAVVRHGIRAARDRHDHFGRVSRNRQLAGGLGDGVVLGNVHVVLVENLHRAGERAYVLALIRALGFVGQVFIPVTGLQTSNRDAGDGLLAAVVHLLSAFAREGHGEARVGDGQLAGGLGNVVVLRYVVALSILNNHVAAERAVVAANILAFRLIGQAFVFVTFHKAALRDAGNALHAAGIGKGLAFAGKGHVAQGNGQRALHAVGEGVARGHVGFAAHDLVARYHVVADADVGLAALDDRGENVAFHQRARVGVAVIRQRRAVVNLLAAVRGDGNGLALALALRDGQLAFILSDGIVVLVELLARGEGDRVGHFALVHEGHAAGGRDADHLARYKAVAAHGDIRLRQRRAVVFLARRLGFQRYGALVDGQRAINAVREGVVPGHVRAVAHDRVALNDVLAFVAHVRGAALDDRRQHVAFHQHVLGEVEAAIRQRGSVVGLAGAVRGDGDLVFRDRVDLQNAVHDHEFNIREVRVRVLEVARNDADQVIARVFALRSPRGGFGRLDAGGHVVQLVVSRHGLIALDAVLLAVVGHDGAVLGDSDGYLVGHRGDRHIAVDHFLDGHVIVGAGDGEGVLGQTHVRRANVRAPGDGEYIGLEADRNLVRLASEAVVVAVRLVLSAVVFSRFIDARDGDGGRSLVDGQRAGFIGYIIIGRNFVAVVFDGIRINHVRGIARVGDGGGRRHGEGEVLLRVAVDQTLNAKIRLGQRLAVVGLIRVPGSDGQGHGVIDRDDVAGRIDRDGLRGSIAGHRGIFILGFQARARTRRQRFADGLGAGFVFGNLDGGAVQVMVDGVARGVELEVQLQHQRTVACDVAGKHVVLVIRFEHVLVVFLSRLIGFGHGNGRVRGGRALVAVVERVSAIDVLIVELDGILGVFIRRPDGVEDVRAVFVVYLHLRVGGDGAFALGVGVPAHEGIARAGEGVCDGGDGRVVGEVFNLVLACAAVGLIGQGCARGTRAPHAGEGHIALDLVLIAGLVGVLAIRPAEEVLTVRRNQLIGGHQVGIAVFRILLAIRRSRHIALAGYVGNGEGAVLGVVGVEGDVAVNLGINVEGLAGAVRAGAPAAPGVAGMRRHDGGLQLIQTISDRAAIGNGVDRFAGAADDGGERRRDRGRSFPSGVNGHVLRRHGLASELELVTAGGRVIPAGKRIAIGDGRRSRRRVVARVRDALLVEVGGRVLFRAVVDVHDVVAVAGIIELGAVILISVLRACAGVAGEAGHFIPLFIRDLTSGVSSVGMIQLIVFPGDRFGVAFTRQSFHIIISLAATAYLTIEILTADRHRVQIRLSSILIILAYIPERPLRPLIANVRAMLGGNCQIRTLFPRSRPPIAALLIELHLIYIALIIHIHDRRAVARDGFLNERLIVRVQREAGIALRRRAGLRAGGAGLGFGFLVGILIVIGVLLPVDDGILGSGVRRPDGVKRQRRGEGVSEGERRAAHGCSPVVEGIAGAGGGGGRGGRAVALYERGRDIGAALRIVGDPVTLLNLGLEGYVAAVQRDGGHRIAALVLPAGNGFLIADGVGDVRGGDGVTLVTLLRDHDFAVRIGEEHEVHVREAGVDGDGRRVAANGRGDGEGKLVSAFVKPADELLVRAVRFRRAGIVERLAVLQNLASEFLRAIHKDIGNSSHRRLHDAEQRKAFTVLRAAGDGHDGRQRVHGRAADEHDKRHQQGKTPTKLVFHKKLILPMKFR